MRLIIIMKKKQRRDQIRNNKLYNYIVNNYGLSKEMVLEYAKDKIEVLIDKHIENLVKQKIEKEQFDRNLYYAIANFIKNEKSGTNAFDRKKTFKDVLVSVVRETVIEEIDSNYEIKLEIKQKGDKDEKSNV